MPASTPGTLRRYLAPGELRADFDRIAAFEPHGSGPEFGRHAWIASQLPPAPARALDLGCGTGVLTRILAERCGEARGIDLSPGMIDRARANTPSECAARFEVGDFRDLPSPGETFDVVTAVAALHHLPIDEALRLAAARVRPGGLLLVVDLHDFPHLPGVLARLAAWSLARYDDLFHAVRVRQPGAREAWLAHGDRERLPTAGEIRAGCKSLNPPGRPAFHPRWRWSLAWRAPAVAAAAGPGPGPQRTRP